MDSLTNMKMIIKIIKSDVDDIIAIDVSHLYAKGITSEKLKDYFGDFVNERSFFHLKIF